MGAIKKAQALEDEKAKQGALAVIGANALRSNPALVEANRDDFARDLCLALNRGVSSDTRRYTFKEADSAAYHIAQGVRAMDSVSTLVRWYPAVRNVILEALSSPDNEREEAQ